MKVNKEIMARARFEKKQINELTIKEFRNLMQQCLDADRYELQRRKNEEEQRLLNLRYS